MWKKLKKYSHRAWKYYALNLYWWQKYRSITVKGRNKTVINKFFVSRIILSLFICYICNFLLTDLSLTLMKTTRYFCHRIQSICAKKKKKQVPGFYYRKCYKQALITMKQKKKNGTKTITNVLETKRVLHVLTGFKYKTTNR